MDFFFLIPEDRRERFLAELEQVSNGLQARLDTLMQIYKPSPVIMATALIRRACWLIADNCQNGSDQMVRKAEAIEVFSQWLDTAFERRNRITQSLAQKLTAPKMKDV